LQGDLPHGVDALGGSRLVVADVYRRLAFADDAARHAPSD